MKSQHDEEIRRKLRELTDHKVDLWPSIVPQLKTNHRRYTASSKMALLAFTVIVAIGLMLWILQPRPISASEIISRAQRATQDAAFKGYEGVIDGRMLFASDPAFPELAEWQYWQNHLWYASPDSQRKEFYIAASQQRVIPRLDNSVMQTRALSHFIPHSPLIFGQLQHVDVKVAAEQWGMEFYFDKRVFKEVAYHSPAQTSPPSDYHSYYAILMSTDSTTGAVDLDHATQFLITRFDHLTLKGEASMAGRTAYIVQFTSLKSAEKYQFDDEIVTAWYDQQTYIMLGLQLEVKINDQFELWGEWHFSTFEVNPTFAPETFVFKPPTDVPVQDTTLQTPTPFK